MSELAKNIKLCTGVSWFRYLCSVGTPGCQNKQRCPDTWGCQRACPVRTRRWSPPGGGALFETSTNQLSSGIRHDCRREVKETGGNYLKNEYSRVSSFQTRQSDLITWCIIIIIITTTTTGESDGSVDCRRKVQVQHILDQVYHWVYSDQIWLPSGLFFYENVPINDGFR